MLSTIHHKVTLNLLAVHVQSYRRQLAKLCARWIEQREIYEALRTPSGHLPMPLRIIEDRQ